MKFIAALAAWGSLCAAADPLYLPGMTGRGDIRAQTRQALAGIAQPKNIVCVTVYVSDLRHMPAVDAVYRQFFKRDFPARTVLEALPMSPGALVEISAIAWPGTRKIVRPESWPVPSSPISYAVQAGERLYLSGLQPVDPATGKLAGDTIQAQTEQVMRNQEEILSAAGMKFADLVSSRIYLTEPTDYAGLNEVYRKFVSAVPPARATVHAYPVEPGRLLQIQSVAVRGSGEGRPSGAGHTSPIHSYSVKAGNHLYITGMTGRPADGPIAKNDIQAQTRVALKTIEDQLTRHGMTFANVVDSTVWLRDARHFTGMDEVYNQIVPRSPARTTVRIPPNSPEGLVEIMMVAAK